MCLRSSMVRCTLMACTGLVVTFGSIRAQQPVYENDLVLVYSVPGALTAAVATPVAERIALALAREGMTKTAGEAVSVLAGRIAGLFFSIIQEIPSVGNPTRVHFDILDQNLPLAAGRPFRIVVLLDTGDCPGATAVSLERPRRLRGWTQIQSRTLLTDHEIWQVLPRLGSSTRMLLVTKRPLTAPATRGRYRLAISSGCSAATWSTIIDVIEWY